MMSPDIIEIEKKQLIGARIRCSLKQEKTGSLWQHFMPKRNQIKNRINKDYISGVKFYEPLDLSTFDEETEFEKWAAVEVSHPEDIPEGLEALEIEGGKYAVFIHKGLSKDFQKTKEEILRVWLPDSGYTLDDRVHFDVMGEKYYGPSDANSEEEIWIPIK